MTNNMTNEAKFTILIVDDERSNIAVLSDILRPEYAVLAAKDGPSALEVAKSKLPDLILLDILMPGMSGFEVLAELKSADATKDIAVIFISALSSDQDEQWRRLGAVDYITKPFRSSFIKSRVRTHQKIIEQTRAMQRPGTTGAEIPDV